MSVRIIYWHSPPPRGGVKPTLSKASGRTLIGKNGEIQTVETCENSISFSRHKLNNQHGSKNKIMQITLLYAINQYQNKLTNSSIQKKNTKRFVSQPSLNFRANPVQGAKNVAKKAATRAGIILCGSDTDLAFKNQYFIVFTFLLFNSV